MEGRHRRPRVRGLLIQGAQAILRTAQTPLAQWGKRLLARTGQINLVVAAIARKLAVTIWYLMMGQWPPLTEIDAVLGVLCPNTLLPYARETVASLLIRAGFPPVVLQHMSFDAAYQERLRQMQQEQAAPAPAGAVN